MRSGSTYSADRRTPNSTIHQRATEFGGASLRRGFSPHVTRQAGRLVPALTFVCHPSSTSTTANLAEEPHDRFTLGRSWTTRKPSGKIANRIREDGGPNMKWRDVRARLIDFSTPFGGANWQYVRTEPSVAENI